MYRAIPQAPGYYWRDGVVHSNRQNGAGTTPRPLRSFLCGGSWAVWLYVDRRRYQVTLPRLQRILAGEIDTPWANAGPAPKRSGRRCPICGWVTGGSPCGPEDNAACHRRRAGGLVLDG